VDDSDGKKTETLRDKPIPGPLWSPQMSSHTDCAGSEHGPLQ